MTIYIRDTIAVTDASADADLWHQRLGHMSEKGLKVMHSLGKLPRLKSINIDFCENCIYGKQKRVSFKIGGRTLRNEKLELIHGCMGASYGFIHWRKVILCDFH